MKIFGPVPSSSHSWLSKDDVFKKKKKREAIEGDP